MTREEFDNQSLPKSDANTNLETLSRDRLKAMFSAEDFELRDEFQHDKGIDLFVEIKSKGNSTNLRFPIQLKAGRSLDKNKDDSISFSIAVTNINYLLNDGLPAFYILYHQSENRFYYERVQEVENRLKEKYADDTYPQHFTFRFAKVLDQEVIGKIHAEMLNRGYLRRSINKVLKLSEDNSVLAESIVVQKDQGVYTPAQNVMFLEKYGFRLLNDGRFSDILEMEKRCYPIESSSPIFHFVCGTAAYYKGLHYEALNHYKRADRDVKGHHPEAQQMMLYFKTQSKRNLGMINEEQCAGYLEALTDSNYLGLYLKLQKAFDAYYTGSEDERMKSVRLQNVVDSVLSSPHCNPSLSLIAESYMLSAEGNRLNDQFLHYLFHYRESMGNPMVSPKVYKQRQEKIADYNRHFKELKEKALKDKNQFTYHNICLNGIKILYTMTYYADIVLGMDRNTMRVNRQN